MQSLQGRAHGAASEDHVIDQNHLTTFHRNRQRRGLGLSSPRPRYVLRVLPEARQVVVGDAEALARRVLDVADFRRLDDIKDDTPIPCAVQIRHRAPAQPATLRVVGSRATVEFDAPVRAVAPGQAAVAFAGDRVLGGGWIESAR